MEHVPLRERNGEIDRENQKQAAQKPRIFLRYIPFVSYIFNGCFIILAIILYFSSIFQLSNQCITHSCPIWNATYVQDFPQQNQPFLFYDRIKWDDTKTKYQRNLTVKEKAELLYITGESFNSLSSDSEIPGFYLSGAIRKVFEDRSITILFTGNSLMRREAFMVKSIIRGVRFEDYLYHEEDIKHNLSLGTSCHMAIGWRAHYKEDHGNYKPGQFSYSTEVKQWAQQFKDNFGSYPKYVTFGGWVWAILKIDDYFHPSKYGYVGDVIRDLLNLIHLDIFKESIFIWRLQPRTFDFDRDCDIQGNENHACSGDYLTSGIERVNYLISEIIGVFNHPRILILDDFHVSLFQSNKDQAHFKPPGVYLMAQNLLHMIVSIESKEYH